MVEPIIVHGCYSAAFVVLDELEKLGIIIAAEEASEDEAASDAKYNMQDIQTAVKNTIPKPQTWEQILELVKEVKTITPTSVTITADPRKRK